MARVPVDAHGALGTWHQSSIDPDQHRGVARIALGIVGVNLIGHRDRPHSHAQLLLTAQVTQSE
jgi:hypothetical protein